MLVSSVLGISVCQSLSVWVQMYPSGHVNVHLYLSLCVRVTSCLLQIQLGSSYLQSHLSCVRSLRARIIQSFLQPSPHHRYESEGDTDTAFHRYPSKIHRKASWGLRETRTEIVVGRDCVCLVRRAINDGAGVHMPFPQVAGASLGGQCLLLNI